MIAIKRLRRRRPSRDLSRFGLNWPGFALGCLLLAPSAGAQLMALGPEFTISQDTTICAEQPSVAMAADGRFVVTWRTQARDELRGRRFDSAGVALGGEQVLITGTGLSPSPTLMADDGTFTLVWDTSPSPTSAQVNAQRFDANGAALGGRIVVNPTTAIHDRSSAAGASDGSFVVAWQEQDSPMNRNVWARRFASDGSAVGSAFVVSPSAQGTYNPSVGMEPDGDGFVIAWQEAQIERIHARRYDGSGNALAAAFQVNSYTSGDHANPNVAVDGSGGFYISWTGATAETANSIALATFDASGTQQLQGGITVPEPGILRDFSQTALSNEGESFFMAWDVTIFPPGQPGISTINAATNTMVDLPIAGSHPLNQVLPSVAMDDRERAVVVWARELPGSVCEIRGVRAQLFRSTVAGETQGAVHSLTQQGAWRHFIYEPQSLGTVTVTVSGAAQDVDLHVRRGGLPDATTFDCRPFTGGSASETCTLDVDGQESLGIAINGFDAGAAEFTLTVAEVPAIFADGFESGDTSKWSATIEP
ncbi:MAG: PPC domain-containing protein [Acidobacteriota bacterium]